MGPVECRCSRNKDHLRTGLSQAYNGSARVTRCFDRIGSSHSRRGCSAVPALLGAGPRRDSDVEDLQSRRLICRHLIVPYDDHFLGNVE
jgi:hypothetical protein